MIFKRIIFLVSILLCASCSTNKPSGSGKKEILYADWKALENQFSYEIPTSADAVFNGTPNLLSNEKYEKESRHYDFVDGKCSPSDELSQFILVRADALYRNNFDDEVYKITYYDDMSVSIKCSVKEEASKIKLAAFENCTYKIHSSGYIESFNAYQRINLAIGDYKESATIRFTAKITYN